MVGTRQTDVPRSTDDATDFSRRLDEAIAASADTVARQSREMESAMAEREASAARFEQVARSLFARIIRPRMEALTSRLRAMPLVHCDLDDCRTAAGVHTRCRFARTARFPAATTLTVGVLHDEERNVASVFRRVEIVPILFAVPTEEHLDVSLEAPDEEAVAGWVEDRLLRFLELYLGLESDPRYQRQNVVQDPVCGMQVSAAVAEHHADHHRHTYHFCSQGCRDKFVADPAFYLDPRTPGRQA